MRAAQRDLLTVVAKVRCSDLNSAEHLEMQKAAHLVAVMAHLMVVDWVQKKVLTMAARSAMRMGTLMAVMTEVMMAAL